MENQTQQQSAKPQMPIQPTVEQKTELKKSLPKLKIAALIILLFLVLAVPLGGYLLLGKIGIHPKPSTVTMKTEIPMPTIVAVRPIPTSTPTPPYVSKPLPTLSANEKVEDLGTTRPVETFNSSWKTYENKNLGLTFSYPEDFIIRDEEPEGVALCPIEEKKYTLYSGIFFSLSNEKFTGASYPFNSDTYPATVSGITGTWRKMYGLFYTPYASDTIQIPYRNGTLEISIVKGPAVNLIPQFMEILKTVVLKS